MFRRSLERLPGVGAIVSRWQRRNQLADPLIESLVVEHLVEPIASTIPKTARKLERATVSINPEEVLVPKTIFMRVAFSDYVHEPQTEVGRELLKRRQEETKIALANVVISRLAGGISLNRLSTSLELIQTYCDPKEVSPNLLIGQEHLRKTEELEEASKAFLVRAVVETAQRLWEMNITEVSASEKNILRQLQLLKARRWTTKKIAMSLCNYYGLPIDEFYKPQPPITPRPSKNIKIIRI